MIPLWTCNACFERVGLHSANVQAIVDLHTSLKGHDSEFDAFSRIAVAPESEFTEECEEPEVESLLPSDPPADSVVTESAAAFEPHSPGHMALWMIQRLTETLGKSDGIWSSCYCCQIHRTT